jgi:hypothetical protein
MLEDFAKHGLVDIATDYGLILLIFTNRGQQQLRISGAGQEYIGAEPTWRFSWQQTADSPGALEFTGREVARRRMSGNLWVRKTDGVPLRVEASTAHLVRSTAMLDDAIVDYAMSAHGFLTPVSVLHRHSVAGQPVTENLYRYEPFKLFQADAEIKFTEVPEPPKP